VNSGRSSRRSGPVPGRQQFHTRRCALEAVRRHDRLLAGLENCEGDHPGAVAVHRVRAAQRVINVERRGLQMVGQLRRSAPRVAKQLRACVRAPLIDPEGRRYRADLHTRFQDAEAQKFDKRIRCSLKNTNHIAWDLTLWIFAAVHDRVQVAAAALHSRIVCARFNIFVAIKKLSRASEPSR